MPRHLNTTLLLLLGLVSGGYGTSAMGQGSGVAYEVRLSTPVVLRNAFHNYDQVMKTSVYPSVGVRVGRRTTPRTENDYAGLYGYPVVGVGGSWEGAMLAQRKGTSDPIRLMTLYGYCEADLIHKGAFTLGIDVALGLGFNSSVYDKKYNPYVANFSSTLLAYVQGGIDLFWQVGQRSDVGLALVYSHLSSGRLAYPNGGWNTLSGVLTARFGAGRPTPRPQSQTLFPAFERHWVFEPYIGGGVHRCAREWMVYESTRPWPNYVAGLMAHYMLRPHYSVGVSLDLTTCTRDFLDRLRAAEVVYFGQAQVDKATYHAPTVGLAWVGQLYYGNLTAYGALGFYAYRQLGVEEQDGALYQKIGIKYTFPQLNNLFIAADCKAHHFSRAAIMNFTVGIRID